MDPLDTIIEKLNGALNSLAASRVGAPYRDLRNALPTVREFNLPTPFGRIRTPEISLPNITPAQLGPERREALKAAVGIDLAQVVSIIPVVGHIAADIVEDTYGERIREHMTPEEYRLFLKHDKLGPSTVAALRAFAGRA